MFSSTSVTTSGPPRPSASRASDSDRCTKYPSLLQAASHAQGNMHLVPISDIIVNVSFQRFTEYGHHFMCMVLWRALVIIFPKIGAMFSMRIPDPPM